MSDLTKYLEEVEARAKAADSYDSYDSYDEFDNKTHWVHNGIALIESHKDIKAMVAIARWHGDGKK